VVSTTPFVSNVSSNRIAFGDGNAVPSRITNAHVEITNLTFNQVPIPAAIWLLGGGLIGLLGLRRRLKS
jgi:hypothetical protein